MSQRANKKLEGKKSQEEAQTAAPTISGAEQQKLMTDIMSQLTHFQQLGTTDDCPKDQKARKKTQGPKKAAPEPGLPHDDNHHCKVVMERHTSKGPGTSKSRAAQPSRPTATHQQSTSNTTSPWEADPLAFLTQLSTPQYQLPATQAAERRVEFLQHNAFLPPDQTSATLQAMVRSVATKVLAQGDVQQAHRQVAEQALAQLPHPK